MKKNKKAPLISVIIRTKNEEQWIAHCLKMVYSQTVKDIEVIIVDNKSTDNTLKLARRFPVSKIIEVKKYFPGKSINQGVRAAKGKYIACLSSHCIPKHEKWLENLLRNLKGKGTKIAGVYGRQVPFKYSADTDKRDLFITFGLDKRVQEKDTFFHNANSMFLRSVWNKFPFNEEVTNIEDRIWGRQVIAAGYKIVYEPEAEVFHCHGIHQTNAKKRYEQTVKIMEDIHVGFKGDVPETFKPGNLNIVAFVPIVGDVKTLNKINLLERSISQLKGCAYIKDIVVVSEKKSVISFVKKLKVRAIKRKSNLLAKGKGVEHTLSYALNQYENKHKYGITDAVLFIDYLFPFRPKNFLKNLVEEHVYSGSDSTFAALKDYRVYWFYGPGGYYAAGKDFKPRSEKKPIYQGLVGLGCITSSRFIRKGFLLGDNVELLNIKDKKYAIKVSDKHSMEVAAFLLSKEGKKAKKK